LSTLGIDLQKWVVNPRIVGTEQVAGVATTRIHAGVDVNKLVADINTLLPKASSTGISSPTGSQSVHVSPASRDQIVSGVRHPSLNVWSASSDRTLRKLGISFDTSGSAQLVDVVGTGSAAVVLTLQVSDVNHPQQINVPTNALPYSAFQGELKSITQPAVVTTPKTNTTPYKRHAKPTGPTELTLSPYAQCISNARGDVTKMQKCASLSNGTSTKPAH
jgi:hypothetical protein